MVKDWKKFNGKMYYKHAVYIHRLGADIAANKRRKKGEFVRVIKSRYKNTDRFNVYIRK